LNGSIVTLVSHAVFWPEAPGLTHLQGGRLMALGRAFSVAVRGLDGEIVEIVEIEADITSGLPGEHLVGLPDAALQESRDRVTRGDHQLRQQLADGAADPGALARRRYRKWARSTIWRIPG
jgi:hypothetical protein